MMTQLYFTLFFLYSCVVVVVVVKCITQMIGLTLVLLYFGIGFFIFLAVCLVLIVCCNFFFFNKFVIYPIFLIKKNIENNTQLCRAGSGNRLGLDRAQELIPGVWPRTSNWVELAVRCLKMATLGPWE